jgi:antitoxin component HigA of HigAB toxin-antitoxin module
MSELRTISMETITRETMSSVNSVKQDQTTSFAFENTNDVILNGPYQISPKMMPQTTLTTTLCCSKCKKMKSKEVPPEWVEEMKDLRERFGLSYSRLAKRFGLTRFVAYHAITKKAMTNEMLSMQKLKSKT